jgi:hypothetical protein
MRRLKTYSQVCRKPDRKASLPDTARPNQADQARGGELLSQFGKLAAAANEARRFSWQVARATDGPGHDEQRNVLQATE